MMKFNKHDSGLTDFLTWWLDHQDYVFRYTVYRRMFTPYEQDQKFIDETCWEDAYSSCATISEAVELPDGDILLGLQNVKDDTADTVDTDSLKDNTVISYYKLSEIRLEYYGMDNILKSDEVDDSSCYNHDIHWDEGNEDSGDGGADSE